MKDSVGGKAPWIASGHMSSFAGMAPVMKSEVPWFLSPRPRLEVLSHSHPVLIVLSFCGTVLPMSHKSVLTALLMAPSGTPVRWQCYVADRKTKLRLFSYGEISDGAKLRTQASPSRLTWPAMGLKM